MLEAVSVFYVIVIPSNTTDPFVVVVIGTIFVWFSPRILVSFRSLGIQFFPVPSIVCTSFFLYQDPPFLMHSYTYFFNHQIYL